MNIYILYNNKKTKFGKEKYLPMIKLEENILYTIRVNKDYIKYIIPQKLFRQKGNNF